MTCKKLSVYLLGKEFTVETDHRNLLFLDFTDVPKLIRWRIFLQTFAIKWRNIKGKDAVLPDLISRLFIIMEDYEDPQEFWPSLAFLFSSEETPHQHQLFSLSSATPQQPIRIATNPGNPAADLDDDVWLQASQQPAHIELDNENNREKAGYPRSRLELLEKAHGGLNFHHGTHRLWAYLNKFYPGHRIPYAALNEFIQNCPICQKNRLHMTENNTLKPIIRSHYQEGASLLSSDYLFLGDATSLNNKGAYVFSDYYKKHRGIYPMPGPSAYNLAVALFTHISRYGYQHVHISDRGSDYTSDGIAQAHQWLGIEHTLALTDVHTSNATERTNREVLQHIRTLLQDDPITLKEAGGDRKIEWDSPVFLAALHIVLNEQQSSETGYTPHELMFGPDSMKNYSFPAPGKYFNANKFLRELGASLESLRSKSRAFMSAKSTERKELTNRLLQNVYQPGDHVCKHLAKPLEYKRQAPYQGPFKVIQQTANDVEVENLITGEKQKFPVHVLKLFLGDDTAAYNAAKLDTQQHDVVRIRSAKGSPNKRMLMEFEVEFADGDIRWLPYSKDLEQTTHFETLCRLRHDLWPLLYTTAVLKSELQILRKPISPFPSFPWFMYVDLRAFGDTEWYEQLPLPDSYHSIFVYECQIINFADPKTKKKVQLFYPLIDLQENVDNSWLHSWGRYTTLQPPMQLIDAKFASTYSQILEPRSRARLLRKFKAML